MINGEINNCGQTIMLILSKKNLADPARTVPSHQGLLNNVCTFSDSRRLRVPL